MELLMMDYKGGATIETNNTTSAMNATFELKNAVTPKAILISLFATLISVWIVFSNALIIVATFQRTRLKTRTGYFICSLALADITSGICNFISGYLRFFGHVDYGNTYICGAFVAIQVFPFLVSLVSLTCMALDRYIAVVLPLKSKTLLTKTRSLWIICFSWIISLAVASPTVLWNWNPKKESCTLRHMNKNYFFFIFQGSFWLLLSVKVYMYIMVIYKLRKHLTSFRHEQESRLVQSSGPGLFTQRRLTSEIQLTKMVLIVLAVFMISWLPMIILYNLYFLQFDVRR